MGSMRTRPSVLSVAMCMEQMDPTCTKGDVTNVRKGLRGSSTGALPTAERKNRGQANNALTDAVFCRSLR